MPQQGELQQACMLRGVGKDFGRTRVLRGLDLVVPTGQKVALIGPSGAGKTTLLRLLAPVFAPSRGAVQVLGQDTARLRGRALRDVRRRVGFLYQNENLIQELRVVHNVLMGRLGRWSLPRALLSLLWPQELNVARTALRQVELEEMLWRLPGTLSGGQQQRVAIARLLVQEPELLLADEPVSSLDVRLGREVIRLLVEIAAQSGATLVCSLHSLDLLGGHFDRVIALKDGAVFWDGVPAELSQALLRDLYGAEYRALRLEDIELEAAH